MKRPAGHLPVWVPRGGIPRTRGRETSLFRIEKWIHAIPVFVLVCLFILWWLSRPVNVAIKDGKIVAVDENEIEVLPLNDTRIELTILASATSPIASVPQNLIRRNETESTSYK